MKRIYIWLLIATAAVFTSCTKQVLAPDYANPQEWMRTHEAGTVALSDPFTGNYIVETRTGFSVVTSLEGYIPRDFDREYAHFSRRGTQTVYNYDGNYFTRVRVVETWLNWQEALYIFDQLNGW